MSNNIKFGMSEVLVLSGCFVYTSNFWLGVSIIAIGAVSGLLRFGIELNNRTEMLKLEEQKLKQEADLIMANMSGALSTYVGNSSIQ